MSVIPINTVEEMAASVKSYIDLETAKEERKMPKEARMKIKRAKCQSSIPQRRGKSRATPLYNALIEGYTRPSHP